MNWAKKITLLISMIKKEYVIFLIKHIKYCTLLLIEIFLDQSLCTETYIIINGSIATICYKIT